MLFGIGVLNHTVSDVAGNALAMEWLTANTPISDGIQNNHHGVILAGWKRIKVGHVNYKYEGKT